MQDLSEARYYIEVHIGWHVLSEANSKPVAQTEQPDEVHILQLGEQLTQDLSAARY